MFILWNDFLNYITTTQYIKIYYKQYNEGGKTVEKQEWKKERKKIRALFLMCLILPFFVFNVYTTLCLTLWVFRRMRSGANNNHFYFYKLEEVSYMVKPT